MKNKYLTYISRYIQVTTIFNLLARKMKTYINENKNKNIKIDMYIKLNMQREMKNFRTNSGMK